MRRFLLATFTLALLTWITIALVPSAIAVPTNVNCNNAQNLQSRIDTAQPGSTVLIKGTCVGNFVVNKNLRLKGNPSATLDGNNAGTTLTVTGTNVHLTGLVITRGIAATGGGINAGNGNLSLLGVTVKGNTATGSVNSSGGGIYSVGSLTIESSAVVNNRAVASGSGATNPRGGGIYSAGTLTLSLSDVSSNL